MFIKFSPETQQAIMPILDAILARFELELSSDDPNIEELESFRLPFLINDSSFNNGNVILLIKILNKYIGFDKGFNFLACGIRRTNPNSTWHSLYENLKTFKRNITNIEPNIPAGTPTLQKTKIEYDSQNAVLKYRDITHKFHRGADGQRKRLKLFGFLWTNRRYLKKGKEIIKGKPNPPEFLAVQLNITSDAITFNRNKEAKIELFNLIKGLNKTLKEKGFPLRIKRKNGIQLVITEK
jgi:hypothetical protein